MYKGPEVGESKSLLRNQMTFVKLKFPLRNRFRRTSASGPRRCWDIVSSGNRSQGGGSEGSDIVQSEAYGNPSGCSVTGGRERDPGKSMEQERK